MVASTLLLPCRYRFAKAVPDVTGASAIETEGFVLVSFGTVIVKVLDDAEPTCAVPLTSE